MVQSRVAVRYATALFAETSQANTLDATIADVRGLRTMLSESRDFALFVESPIIKTSQKSAALKVVAEKAQFAPTTKNFLQLLVEKSRINELSSVLDSFETLYNERKGLLPIEVISAVELDSTQKENLLKKIEDYTGKKPLPSYSINIGLVGGFTVKIGDSMLDNSIKRQLEVLKKRLMEGEFSN
jgi:F-type H+-transporting ATPase subunit delta